ncbi:larval cuticle protein A2B-like [Scaptodrosophila lebanonensis]|uniref:Larval cuticle protein A2B-like n=1 Tax=Drosophila lebanonensis TaxID=7225 RepID=A0A6J2TGT1_DROLE|nr:larval cuticle protein A2B-like [Scaptodrosophila lebanonensis]
MAFKFVALLALIAAASAGVLPAAQVYHAAPAVATYHHAAPAVATYHHAAPAAVVKTVAQPVYAKAAEEYDPHPQYKFAYDVQDSLSGDSKSQVEERDGDVVRGEYSLIDADGYKRTVQYTADPINGFNAVVNREPLVKAVAAAPVAHYAAPTVVKTVAPVAHYAAPAVAHYAAPAVAHYRPRLHHLPSLNAICC